MALFSDWKKLSTIANDSLRVVKQLMITVGLIIFSIVFAVFVVVCTPLVVSVFSDFAPDLWNRGTPVFKILLQNETLSVLNLSNMAFIAVFIVLISTLVILDRLLIEIKDMLRKKSKAPAQHVINYYNPMDAKDAARIITSKKRRKL
ncbi:unnamed protein product [Phytomonas sp. Hart1]|nr:unnamed protein product [Phytomonas sp. Hart1]|eukprot:CCW68935.1 unnamed protein product [Phytomonas sp. isolate Hart1]